MSMMSLVAPAALALLSIAGGPPRVLPPRRAVPPCCSAEPGAPPPSAPGTSPALPTSQLSAPRKIRGLSKKVLEQRERDEQKRRQARRQGKSPPVSELQRLRITGGVWRGQRIATPDVYLRPMMSRVREALFSMLRPTGVLRESAQMLDIFAGSGVIGVEALSRGIGRASFVDMSATCTATIRANCDGVGAGPERAQVIEARAEHVLATPSRYGADGTFELVTLTPPYEEVVYSELVSSLAASPAVGEDTLIAIEYPVELGIFPPTLADGKLVGLRNRRYGRTVLALYICRPSGRVECAVASEEFVAFK